jgi:hypothetical protein
MPRYKTLEMLGEFALPRPLVRLSLYNDRIESRFFANVLSILYRDAISVRSERYLMVNSLYREHAIPGTRGEVTLFCQDAVNLRRIIDERRTAESAHG